MLVDVTFLSPLPTGYTYRVPQSGEKRVQEGTLVVAPLRRRRLAGVVTRVVKEEQESPPSISFKPILFIPFEVPLFTPEQLGFFQWCARYYHVPLGGILKTALPLPRRILKGERLEATLEGEKWLTERAGEGDSHADLFLRLWRKGEELLPLIGRKDAWESLLDWTAKRWVEWDYPGFAESFNPETTYYSLASELPPSYRLGPKEREIVDYLEHRGVADSHEIRERFPKASRRLRRLVEKGILCEIVRPDPLLKPDYPTLEEGSSPALTHEQRVALSAIMDEMASPSPQPILLHGVTGGGKTELYIQAIQATLQKGKSSLVLVPEIVLTPQLVSRIQSRCHVPVITWHSRLTEKERWQQWLQLHGLAPVVVIGARSAVFMPVKELGLIIVDEEHDPSFKQEEGLLYHARDMAVVRSRHQSCPLILGSATPSIESYYNVKSEKFRYAVLTRRPTGQPLPKAEVVDLRKEGFPKRQETRGLMLSRPLREALMETYAAGQQSLLFLNRRGYARFVTCIQCGEAITCPHCSVSLILHKPAVLRCHYCGFSRKLPAKCETCGGALTQVGGGTQRLEEEIRGVLPEARIARLDRDTMQKRSLYETLLSRLRRRELDVLIGTQMIVKGHDYPGIVLMGILMADHSLRFPDFRASERTFQLLTQASGRCGRGSLPGRVVIQTFSPEHYSIQHAVHHDFIGFYEDEIRFREELGYPPFSRLVVIRISGPHSRAVERKSSRVAAEGRRIVSKGKAQVQVLGPTPALLARLKNRYRWQVLLRGRSSVELHQAVERVMASKAAKPEKGMKIQVEFDPVQLA